jgi:peptide/nickel transport system permease protein
MKFRLDRSKPLSWLGDRHPTMFLGILLLLLMSCIALGTPLLTTIDPEEINPIDRLQSLSLEHWFGTDHLGRDIFARTMYGSRISLIVGVCVSTMSTLVGLIIGLVSGYHRRLDAVVMRVMDGMMAIPGILLAIALMALMRASVRNVILALTIPEIPRVVRLVRALVLSLREQPFVEAMQAAGAGIPRILFRHIMPIRWRQYWCKPLIFAPRRSLSRPTSASWVQGLPRMSPVGGISWLKAVPMSNWPSGLFSSLAFL